MLDDKNNDALFMEFAGITLRDLHQQDDHQFTEDEICFIAWNLIDLLEALHK